MGFIQYFFGSIPLEIGTKLTPEEAACALESLAEDEFVRLAEFSPDRAVIYSRKHMGFRGTPLIPVLTLLITERDDGTALASGAFEIAQMPRFMIALFACFSLLAIFVAGSSGQVGALIGALIFACGFVAIMFVAYRTGRSDIEYIRDVLVRTLASDVE